MRQKGRQKPGRNLKQTRWRPAANSVSLVTLMNPRIAAFVTVFAV